MIDTPKELKDFIVKILEDKNAQNITVLKLGNEVPLATYMIFASG
jgi:ribosomal silencing factor RsfS